MMLGRRLALRVGVRAVSTAARAEAVFLDWLRDGGARFDKLAIAHTGAGREVVATAAYAAGEALLVVPPALLLTVARAGARPDVGERLAAARAARVDGNDGVLALASFLANDRSKFWAPYRGVINRSVDHFPVFWPTRDEALLEGSSLAEDVRERRAAVSADLDGLGVAAPADRVAYAIAEATVLSRAFRHGGSRALVPLADLMNTARHHERDVDFFEENGAFVMRAIRGGARGDPVRDSYGPKSNARYLLSYGFALAGNDDARGESGDRRSRNGEEFPPVPRGGPSLGSFFSLPLSVVVGLDDVACDVTLPEAEAFGPKAAAWPRDGASDASATLRIRLRATEPIDALLSAHRVAAASPDEFARLETSTLAPLRRRAAFDGADRPHLAARAVISGLAAAPFLSDANEAAALAAIADGADAAAARLKDGGTDDGENARNARVYLDGQRAAYAALARRARERAVAPPAP